MSSKLIIIEDDLAIIHLLKRYMKRIDWHPELIHFEYGTDALAYFAENQCDNSVLLLDLNLPDMSGIDILEHLRQNPDYIDLPVIVLTTSNLDDERHDCLALGVDQFLEKPVHFEDLLLNLANLDLISA